MHAPQVGFDFITQQPNYAFRDTTKLRFVNVSVLMVKFTTGFAFKQNYITPPRSAATGVEMELGLTVRNHLINSNATQSFYDYVSGNALLALFACCV